MKTRLRLLPLTLLAALVVPARALADDQYGGAPPPPPPGTDTGDGPGPETVVQPPMGDLPFTGFELGFLIAIALCLLVAGITLRQAAQRRRAAQ